MMIRYQALAVSFVLLSALVSPRVEAASLELSPATAVLAVGDQIEILIYGTDFIDGTDGGDFSLGWTANLAYVGFTIVDPPWDVSSFDDSNAAGGIVDAIDVFSVFDTPGVGGGAFEIARLRLTATAEGTGNVTLGLNLVGWSLAGDSLEYSLGSEAQLEILPIPEPGTAILLGLALGLLASVRRDPRRDES